MLNFGDSSSREFAPGEAIYHALNRTEARLPLLQKPGDNETFEQVLLEALERNPIRILDYCLMPNQPKPNSRPAAAASIEAARLGKQRPPAASTSNTHTAHAADRERTKRKLKGKPNKSCVPLFFPQAA